MQISLIAPGAMDVYFDADIWRVYWNIFFRADQIRSGPHPLFALLVALPFRAFQNVTGLEPVQALPFVIAFAAAAFGGLFFLCFRGRRFSLSESSVAVFLAAMTGSWMVFFSIPETFSFGAISIVFVLLCLGLRSRRGSVLSLILAYGITVTNIAASLFSVFLGFSTWTERLRIVVLGGVAIILLTAIQLVPGFPVQSRLLSVSTEDRFIKTPSAARIASVFGSVFLDGAVMPTPKSAPLANEKDRTAVVSAVTLEGASYGRDLLSLAAMAGWLTLLVLGTYSIYYYGGVEKYFVSFILIYNLVLHSIYGNEVFLFSLHWMPVLIFLAAFSLRLPAMKSKGLAIVAAAGVLIGVHNYTQISNALELVHLPKAATETAIEILVGDKPLELKTIDGGVSEFRVDLASAEKQVLSIKSAANRPIASLARDGGYLYVNYRWVVVFSTPVSILFGDEGRDPLFSGTKLSEEFEPPHRFTSGMGYAVIRTESNEIRGCVFDSLSGRAASFTGGPCDR